VDGGRGKPDVEDQLADQGDHPEQMPGRGQKQPARHEQPGAADRWRGRSTSTAIASTRSSKRPVRRRSASEAGHCRPQARQSRIAPALSRREIDRRSQPGLPARQLAQAALEAGNRLRHRRQRPVTGKHSCRRVSDLGGSLPRSTVSARSASDGCFHAHSRPIGAAS
jgi:hypothetical protein